jgi:hypothetical protein
MCAGHTAEGRVLAVGERRRVRETVLGPDTNQHDFACAYEIAIDRGDDRSSEEWARAAWEGAATPLRWFMVAGWRFVLGLRLGPRPSPDYILGWQIVERDPDRTVCQLRSSLLAARNTFRKADGRFIWSTFVTYERPIARIIWPPVSVVHRILVRVALRKAANS